MIYVLLGIGFVVCVLVSVLAYHSTAAISVKMMVLPLLVCFISLSVYQIVQYRGAPIEGFPKNFVYVHHVSDATGQKITRLWAYEDETHRLYVFPYSRENEKELNEMKEKQEKGITSHGTSIRTETGITIVPNDEMGDLEVRDPLKNY